VSITVASVNDPPVAVALQRNLNEDTAVTITLLASDADGDALGFAIADPPQHGTLTGTPPSVTYTPAANYNGPDSFTYTASDGTATSAPATVTLSVLSVDDAPVAIAGAVTTAEDTPVAITLTASDIDSTGLGFSINTFPSDGTLTGSGASWTYTPAANVNGVRSFTFRVSDGTLSSTATVTITIMPVNDPPTAVDDFVATNPGTALTIDALANDTDADADALTIASIGTPAHGRAELTADGKLLYTPDPGFTGVDVFDYTVVDPSGASATASAHAGVGQFPQGAPTETILALSVSPSESRNAPSLSSDGRYIAFTTNAALVAADTNGVADVYLYDRGTRTVIRVSEPTGGGPVNGASRNPRISADGRYVVFESIASTLVAGDTNNDFDVFRHDRLTGETVRVSVATGGGQASGDSTDPRISDDGNLIAFTSSAFDLVANDANGASDIFVRDMTAGTTARVSVSATGGDADLASTEPAISGDGRFVAFSSPATNLVAGDGNGASDIFVRDLVAGATVRVSVSSTGTEANKPSTGASLSRDGRFVSFLSSATNLVTGASGTQVYVRDTQALTTTRPLTSTTVAWARLSGDGRYLTALTASGVSICDRFAAITVTPPGSSTWLWPSFSGNGRYVAVITSPGAGSLVVTPNPL
jgi:Tol biopolymer transport system component